MKAGTSMTRSHKTALALAVMVAMGGAVAPDAGASAFASVALPTTLQHGDAVLGALPMTEPMHVTVALKLRDEPGLDAFIAHAASNRARGLLTPAMTSAEFLARHAPTLQQAQAVADYLTDNGFQHVAIAPNRLLVTADGTASSARIAFMTTLAQVRTQDGRIAYANIDEVRIPRSLSDKVLAVVGMQTVHQAHTFIRQRDPQGVHTDVLVGHVPTDFPTIYGTASAAAASAVPVGMISYGDLTQTKADLAKFAAQQGLVLPAITVVHTDGSSNATGGTNEWDLDSQDILGMAGAVKSLTFYDIPNLLDTSLTDDFNTVVAANKAKIINVSLGGCELDAKGDGSAAAQDVIFKTAVAQGQTFSISTGDSGADECGNGTNTPSWPAASQYVVAAAGTDLDTTGATGTTWNNETVWTESGGSQSTFEAKPTWQTTFGVTGTHRVVADIAFDADPTSGAEIIFNGNPAQFGGTSLSAPLFAGLWARVLQKYPTVGFAAPVIYMLQQADFHDITSGKNSGGETGVGFSAKAGYDYASGRGSMMVDAVIADIGTHALGNKKPVASFSFAVTGLSVSFTDTSTDPEGSTLSHAWTFGDGGTSTAADPVHVYSVAGTYSVKEVVKDEVGATQSKIHPVTVN